MKIYYELNLYLEGKPQDLYFGVADNDEEAESIHRLRFSEYSKRGYINPSLFSDKKEADAYDLRSDTIHFIARLGVKIVGYIRLVRGEVLPTETAFKFEEPLALATIPRDRRVELGRFIIIPPDRERQIFLPRNLVMLFIFKTLVQYGMRHSVDGGYVFLKSSLEKKLTKIKFPIRKISVFKLIYPKEGVLFPYFHQKADQVAPFFFITEEVRRYIDRLLQNSFLFRSENNMRFVLKSNLYTKFLRAARII